MDNKEIQAKQVELPAEVTTQVSGEQIKQSRRRLFRQGASVVAVTLASRPVLAWQCQSPSAWGSEAIDKQNGVTNSHRANAGHKAYLDETWKISNWRDNTERAGLGKPWDKLKAFNSDLFKDSKGNAIGYKQIKVAKLVSTLGLVWSGTYSADDKVVDKLSSGTNFYEYTIVAQLNQILLAGTSDLDQCVTLTNLKDMASGSYSPLDNSKIVWGPTDIKKYLYNNYIVRP